MGKKHKTIYRPQLIVSEHLPMEPTPERQAKPDFETIEGKRWKLNTIRSLNDSGEIDGAAVKAAVRWLTDYVYSRWGVADFLHQPLPEGYVRGDVHTFAISRGYAGARVSEVRETLGVCTHERLEMLLVQELSFSAMGRHIFPHKERTVAVKDIRAQCAFLLEQLADFYRKKAKQIKREKELARVPQNEYTNTKIGIRVSR